MYGWSPTDFFLGISVNESHCHRLSKRHNFCKCKVRYDCFFFIQSIAQQCVLTTPRLVNILQDNSDIQSNLFFIQLSCQEILIFEHLQKVLYQMLTKIKVNSTSTKFTKLHRKQITVCKCIKINTKICNPINLHIIKAVEGLGTL